jgi:hypothetical protein
LREVFMGSWVGLDDVDADVHYRADVPPEQVVGVWIPGDVEFDRYPKLLRD